MTDLFSRRAMLRAGAAGGVLAALGTPAWAAPFDFKLTGFSGQNLKGGPIAIPSYQITFFTAHQNTAVADVMVRTRLTSTLRGVGEAKMRALTEEAYTDFKAQLAAANLEVAPQEAVKEAVAGIEFAPENRDIKNIKAGITIGKSIKKGYAAYGAAEAPLVTGLHSAMPMGAGGIMSRFGGIGKFGGAAKKLNGVITMPCLVLDFAQAEAKTGVTLTGKKKAMATSELAFGVAMTSNVALNTAMNKGYANTPGGMSLTKDYWDETTKFATVAEGEGAVQALSVSTVTDEYYIDQDTARGDAVIVDLPVWEGLVRDAYKSFNSAIVADFKKARG